MKVAEDAVQMLVAFSTGENGWQAERRNLRVTLAPHPRWDRTAGPHLRRDYAAFVPRLTSRANGWRIELGERLGAGDVCVFQ